MPTPIRFEDPGLTEYAFLDEISIVCPSCHAQARMLPVTHDAEETDFFNTVMGPKRLLCSHCGLIRHWSGGSYSPKPYSDPVIDPYLGWPLWFQAPCCGHVLWAYNERHLDFIRRCVQATLRVHHEHPVDGWNNQSLANRLPEWMLSAKHRDSVLRTLTRLQKRASG